MKDRSSKSGIALVIAIGFLAILTILVISFSVLIRTERLAGRTYLAKAQTDQLVQTALARAMEDIEITFGTNYPDRLVLASVGDSGQPISTSVDFTVEEDFLPLGNTDIRTAFNAGRSAANWETVSVGGTNIGRVAYLIVNTSGMLDANAVGGLNTDGTARPRGPGISPAEIQLSSELLTDLQNDGGLIQSNGTFLTTSDAGYALVHNREKVWNRFETLRDILVLNDGSRGHNLSSQISSFSTFSFSPPNQDQRIFMGTNSATLQTDILETELNNINAADSEFVLNQLRDYLDEDTLPEDVNGDYTDFSVEPVPLINEFSLVCNFQFIPLIENADEGSDEAIVSRVTITNIYSVNMETWYPFVGYTNSESYTVSIPDPPFESAALPPELFGNVQNWFGEEQIPAEFTVPGSLPYNYTVSGGTYETSVSSANELVNLFNEMQSNIQFPSILCVDSEKNPVDRVLNLEFPLGSGLTNSLLPAVATLSKELFDPTTAAESSIAFTISMACIDPRLNFDGTDANQWTEISGLGDSIDTMGQINEDVISDAVDTPDPTDMIYVRNQDRIDSPWEFTYLLYNTRLPWKTFQMLEEYDSDDTRFILNNLSPHPDGPPTRGRINPHSPHRDVLASVFLEMPIDEFVGDGMKRMDAEQATDTAELIMEKVADNKWPTTPADFAASISVSELQRLLNGSDNPWELESLFRNSYELFNPHDTLYTILLVAQSGSDTDENLVLSDDEVRASRQALAYVWRDAATGKAAVVFYGQSDTLRSTIGNGQSWNQLLQAFAP
ncbi:hypothetical protein P4E94_17115 [Pontiellaceae bacterium B12219]|nr:hypothetical protein [Pontiellaceae bacterium B12219]